MKAYITGTSAISSQNTFDKSAYLKEWAENNGNYFNAKEPSYRDIINPMLSRRMSRVIKMAIATSVVALEEANIKNPDAIIVGTGLGCVADTVKFLKNINESKEDILSPTAFIQSTHNTIAGQIALLNECPGYNFTYSNRGLSFENALIDTFLQLEDGLDNILVGAADETTPESFEILQKIGCADSINLDNKIGYGEGATFFVLSKSNQNSTVGIKDLRTFSSVKPNEFEDTLNAFFKNNSLTFNDIDIILNGRNHSVNDLNFDRIKSLTNERAAIVDYKPLSGEYMTAAAFGVHLGYMMLKNKDIIDQSILKLDYQKPIKNILIYNNYRNINHSLILLSSNEQL